MYQHSWDKPKSCDFTHDAPEGSLHHFCNIPTKNELPKSYQKKTSSMPKLKDILKNNCPVLFKNVTIMEGKGSLTSNA